MQLSLWILVCKKNVFLMYVHLYLLMYICFLCIKHLSRWCKCTFSINLNGPKIPNEVCCNIWCNICFSKNSSKGIKFFNRLSGLLRWCSGSWNNFFHHTISFTRNYTSLGQLPKWKSQNWSEPPKSTIKCHKYNWLFQPISWM